MIWLGFQPPASSPYNWIVADGTDYALVAMTALDDTVADGTQFAFKIRLRPTVALLTGTVYLCGWSRGNVRIANGNVVFNMKDTTTPTAVDLINVTTTNDLPSSGEVLIEVVGNTGATPSATISFNGASQTFSGTPVIASGTVDFIAGASFGLLATNAGASILNNCSWSDLSVSFGGVETIKATENAAGLNAGFNDLATPAATITGTFADA